VADFKFRIDDDELKAWRRTAAKLGMSLSAYVKARVRGVVTLPAPDFQPKRR
jgi:hypothetical protein